MHPALKRGLENLLAPVARVRLSRSRASDGVLVLAYHNIVPDALPPVGDRPLHLPQATFARQLDFLQQWFHVIPLAALAGPGTTAERPCAIITFDDAYRGAVSIGLAELESRGLPATVFVAPGLLNDHSFWWDALARGADGLDRELRRRALGELRGEDAAVRVWAATRAVPSSAMPEVWRSATETELQGAMYPGLSLGSHTWSHPNLARLDGDQLGRELQHSRQWLEQHFGGAFVPWLTYPYGLFSASVLEAAVAAGYVGAFRIDGGWARPRPGRFDLPRLNVASGLSIEGFALRAAGLLAR
jgi:peptidoglycan/xylan/chitin deacetylase (PgdA/CDA1 family)